MGCGSSKTKHGDQPSVQAATTPAATTTTEAVDPWDTRHWGPLTESDRREYERLCELTRVEALPLPHVGYRQYYAQTLRNE